MALYSRAFFPFDRLVVVGAHGYVTLAALRWLADEPGRAHREPWLERARRWGRRRLRLTPPISAKGKRVECSR